MQDTNRFALYLLSRMRCKERVQEALASLGSTQSEMESVAKFLGERLERPGVTVQVFESLIGMGKKEEKRESEDEYGRVARTYTVGLWPDFELVLLSNDQRIFGGLRFERTSRSGIQVTDIHRVKPWEIVEDDLLSLGVRLRVSDEWYPMKDAWFI